MTREDADFIGAMNMCDEISDEAYKKIMCHCEGQQPCEDAISRAEVKKIAKEMYLEVANMKLDVNTISDCISYTSSKCREVLERKLQALPSVTPKQKTGKWKVLGYDDPLVRLYKCPECHMKITLKFKYCPNCGTKMENQDE